VLNTTVTLTGSSTVALARNPRRNTAVARTEPAQPSQTYQQQYSDSGEPAVLTPQPQFFPGRSPIQQQQQPPQQQADDGYIYPADGSSSDARYPAPRGRRAYDGQVYYYQQQQPPQTYDGSGYQYQQPQRYYYQQRGLY
jgi:hypothetical protein